ncbi:MFS transporter [Phytohabitans aurantiacus]|uniref:MFS transporter n=1 Tax=Phytohabitans aurantiacus TaxID=3016789 RepID=A0ABQ5RAQ0_9ACTN|nr:MFS transporter [Phytohabitans aurantiacus]GLI02646.1 MFS transporter [Phytohabitans aurantiacus]
MVVSTRRANGALAALAVATFVYVTTEVLPIGLLTVMAADLGRSPSEIGLLVTGYAVVVVLVSLPLTRLTQRVPRRLLLTVTLGVFVLGAILTALASNYWVLLGARLVIAVTQALFWSVVAAAATGLFPPEVRGRAVGRLAMGTSLAPVLGIPAGTWLGQQAGWRVAFLVMAAAGLATCVAIAVLVPTIAPGEGGAARGSQPDGRRFAILVVAAGLGVTGALTAYTYVTPFVLDVTGFEPSALGPLLLVTGVSGAVGAVAVGRHLDRRPWAAVTVPLGAIAAALAIMWAAGTVPAAVVGALAIYGVSFSAMAAAIQNRTLRIAPGSTDIASAGISTAFNAGIAGGSLLGGVLVDTAGLRSVALVGALLVAAAVAALLGERLLLPADPVLQHEKRQAEQREGVLGP